MEHRIIPCDEGEDEFIADKLNAITSSKIDFEDTIEDELVVFKVTDSADSGIVGTEQESASADLKEEDKLSRTGISAKHEVIGEGKDCSREGGASAEEAV